MARKKKKKEPSAKDKKIQKIKRAKLDDLLKKAEKGHKWSTDDYSFFNRELETQEDTNGKHMTVPQAAEYMGKARRTIYYHINKGNLRQRKDGLIAVEDLDRLLAGDQLRGETPGIPRPQEEHVREPTEREKADLRYRLARAEYNELMLEQARDKLLDRDLVENALIDRAILFRRGLDILKMRMTNWIGMRSKKKLQEITMQFDEEIMKLLEAYTKDFLED